LESTEWHLLEKTKYFSNELRSCETPSVLGQQC